MGIICDLPKGRAAERAAIVQLCASAAQLCKQFRITHDANAMLIAERYHIRMEQVSIECAEHIGCALRQR